MIQQLPESNADLVALNLANHAIVDDVLKPGDAIAELLDRMATIARDIAGDHRYTSADWFGVVDNLNEVPRTEIHEMMDRHGMAMTEVWAKQWMLSRIAKHLHEELDRVCHECPPPAFIASVEYD